MDTYSQTLLAIAIGLLLLSCGLVTYHYKSRRNQPDTPPLLQGFFGLCVLLPLVFSLTFGLAGALGLNAPPPDDELIANQLKRQVPNADLQRIDFLRGEARAWVLLTIGEHQNVMLQATYAGGHWQLQCQDTQGRTKSLNDTKTAAFLQQTAQCG